MLVAMCVVSVVGAVPFDLQSGAWDGLSEVAAMARAMDVRVEAGPATADDAAILVLWPATRVDAVALAGNRPNVRIAVFDDFGGELSSGATEGGADEREREGGDDVRANLYWRGIRDFPVARARRAHPTTTGVRDVVMNRPAPESRRRNWQSASAILEFSAGSAAVVAGANLVLGADPSLFINRMLAFGDNRRFVENLLRWLSLGGRVRVKLVVGNAARGIALLHRPGGAAGFARHIVEALADVDLKLGRRAEPVASAEWALAVGVLMLGAWALSRWALSREALRRRTGGAFGGNETARAMERIERDLDDAWFDLRVRLDNARGAKGGRALKALRIPFRWGARGGLGGSRASVRAAHALLDALEEIPGVERLLPPPVGVAARSAAVDRR